MKFIISRYNQDIDWVKEYTDDYVVYDRSDTPLNESIVVPNIGHCDYDKLTYIIDNYDNLPEVFVLTKANIFKYIGQDELDVVIRNKDFTPLMSKRHKVYSDQLGQVCFYESGIYWERNNDWYTSAFPCKYFNSFNVFAKEFGLPMPKYIPFSPGGNYIVTRERIHLYPKDFYD